MTELAGTTNLAGQQAAKTVAVAVQLIPKPELTREEQISLRHLIQFL